jgi:pimeloyl-ACP methyl ester carboxylesterase
MTEHTLDTPEGPLAYCLLGKGSPRIAVLPGWAINTAFLQTTAQWRTWEAWAERVPTLMLDRRGSGGSHANRGEATPEQTADDLAMALEHAQAGPVTVWAQADAALAAITLAARHRERVTRLVLQAPFARLLAAPDYPHGLSLQSMMALAVPLASAPVMTELDNLGMAEGVTEDGPARFRPSVAPGLMPRLLNDVASTDARPVLPSLKTPTTVLHGSEDRVIPPAGGQEVARLIPGARYEMIEGMGHLPTGSQLETLMERVAALLDEGS